MCHCKTPSGRHVLFDFKRDNQRRRASGAPSTFLGYDDEVDTGHIFNAEQKELLNLIEKEDVNEVREFFARGPAFDVSRGETGRVALRSSPLFSTSERTLRRSCSRMEYELVTLLSLPSLKVQENALNFSLTVVSLVQEILAPLTKGRGSL